MKEDNIISDKDVLMGKSVSGNATFEEVRQMEFWKADSKNNQQIYNQTLKVWENCGPFISDEKVVYDKQRVDAAIGRNLAAQVRKMRRQSIFYKIAAILAFPLALGISFYYFSSLGNNDVQPLQICEITSPKGHVSKCVLPDGTEIWVNTGSTISYNTTSFNRESREVELDGEAYFEVTKNAEKPFKVNTTLANIKVTGTSFNVKAYPESGDFETVLAEGSIEMQLNTRNRQTVQLVPGERAVFDLQENGVAIDIVDAQFFTSWRNGEILFKDATLNDLVKELERIYDIRFHMKDETLGEFRFRGMFSYNNNLIDALEKIKRTSGIGYYIENKEVWLSKK